MKVDKSDLETWRRNEVTHAIWKELCNQYKPYANLRTCDVERVEYYRGQLDLLEDLQKIFMIPEYVKNGDIR